MKNAILGLIAVISISFSLQAQNPQRTTGTPEEVAKQQTERMKKDLGLNDDQVTKVSEINFKFIQKQRDLRKNAGEDRAAMREAMNTARTNRKEELKAVLSAEQYKKMLAQEKEMMQKQRQGRGQGRGQR